MREPKAAPPVPQGTCAHLLGAEPGPAPVERLAEFGRDFLGPTLALVACRSCGATGILEAVQGGEAGDRVDTTTKARSFAFAPIDREIAARFVDKAGRPTCKLDQYALEVEALLSRREPTALLFTIEAASGRLSAVARPDPGRGGSA